MNHRAKTVCFVMSGALNVLFILLIILSLAQKTASLAFYDLDEDGQHCLTAAVVASVPAESPQVVFNAVELTIRKGQTAALQFSAVLRGRQVNWLISALYDHDLIEIRQTGFGIRITALREGVTVLQTVSEDGIRDLARVAVIE